jgi:hypothetical protein
LLDGYVIRPGQRRGASQDGGSYAFLVITLIVGCFLALVTAAALPWAAMPDPPAILWVGIVATLLGVALRWYAILTLG